MAQKETYPGVLKTAYSKWHRSKHSGIAYSDIDKISLCPGCGKPLLIADTIFNKNDQFRTKSGFAKKVYLKIAKALELTFFEIYYTTVKKQDHTPLEKIAVRRIFPTGGPLTHLLPDQWLQFLEHMVLKHAPDCPNKGYFRYRINQKNDFNKDFKRKKKYDEILSS